MAFSVRLEGLDKRFGRGAREVHAVRDLTLEIGTLVLFQQIGCSEEQPGHMPSEQPTFGFAACFRRTPACNHPAHRGAFAAVTKLFDLASELTTSAAPIGPTLQQI